MQFSWAQLDYRNFTLHDSDHFSFLYPKSFSLSNNSGAYSNPNVTGVTLIAAEHTTRNDSLCDMPTRIQVTVIPNTIATLFNEEQLNSFLDDYFSPINQKEQGIYSVKYGQTYLSSIPARTYSYDTDIHCNNREIAAHNQIIYSMYDYRIYAVSMVGAASDAINHQSEFDAMINSFQMKKSVDSLIPEYEDMFGATLTYDEYTFFTARNIMCHITSNCGIENETSNELNMDSNKTAILNTVQGNITVKLLPNVAPKHVENFEKLAHSGFYNNTIFHRIVKGFVIQGGDPLTKNNTDVELWGTGDAGYFIQEEFNDVPHIRGVLSMARASDPNSASSQFFIVLNDSRFLDRQYTAFGKVTSGMEVVDSLALLPTNEIDQPQDPNLARINSIVISNRNSTNITLP